MFISRKFNAACRENIRPDGELRLWIQVLGRGTSVKCTGTSGRCGAATPQRPSFSHLSWQGVSCPELSLPSAEQRFCRPQCYCHRDLGSWTDRYPLRLYGYKKYLVPIFGWEHLRESLCWEDSHTCASAAPFVPTSLACGFQPGCYTFSSLAALFWGCGGSPASLTTATSFGNHRSVCISLAVTEEALPAPHPVPDRQFACRNRNIRSWILQRIDTWPIWDTAPCAGILPCTLSLPSLPFCEPQKIPQQLVFHPQSLRSCIHKRISLW